MPPKLFTDFGATVTGTVLFTSNIVFWRKSVNYFEPATDWNPLVHTWSLGVEEQFYIVFPLFLLAIRRLRGPTQLQLTALVALLSLICSIWGTANAPTATFYLLPTRAWELLTGALPALWMVHSGRVEHPHDRRSRGFSALAALAGLTLVMYSLVKFNMAILFASLGAAYVSWRWIEQPFRIQAGARQSPIQRHPLFAGAAVAGAAIAACGSLVVLGNGWPRRFPGIESVAIERQLRADANDRDWQAFADQHRAKCFATGTATWSPTDCLLTRNHETNALLWGDSFAASYAPGFFAEDLAQMNVQQYTFAQCPPILDYDAVSRHKCKTFNQHVMEKLRGNAISTVIMAANWSAYLNRHKLVYADIGRTVAALEAMHVHVILVGQSPVFPFAYPDDYFFQRFGATQRASDYYAPITVDADMNRQIERSAGANVDVFFDPLRLLCRDDGCLFKRGASYLFEDYGHFSRYDSRIAVDGLLRATREGAPGSLCEPKLKSRPEGCGLP